jgi:3-dehydrosphinganine reductase
MKIKAKLEPGKIAVVTGGSSGIGKAIACDLAERGMHVWLVAQRNDLLESACLEVGSHRNDPDQKIGTISADVSEPDQVRKAVNQVSEVSGHPDLLINSAGVTHPGYVEQLDLDIFNWMMEVNYFGTVYMTKEVIPAMIKRGSGYIVNISSGAGFISYFGYSAYAASKFAVRGFTQALRQEMKVRGIGVSIVYPPDTDTPQLEYEDQFKPPETKALSGTGGLMKPSEVASTVLKGIARGQYRIIPGFELKLYYRLSGLSEGLLHFIIDRIILNIQKKKNSSLTKEA